MRYSPARASSYFSTHSQRQTLSTGSWQLQRLKRAVVQHQRDNRLLGFSPEPLAGGIFQHRMTALAGEGACLEVRYSSEWSGVVNEEPT